MNFRKEFERHEESFQIAPLIDIVFLLLTFFIVTGALAAEERQTPVELPRTSSAAPQRHERLDVVVSVARDGQIWILNQRYSLEKLRRVLIDLQQSSRSVPVSVIIRADGKALYEDVAGVIDACAAVKLRNLSFVSVHAGRQPGE